MVILLLAALIGVPLIEIGLFIKIGGLIGLWPTLALVLLTAALGTWQLRAQGLATLARGRQQLERGQLPTRELFNGFCLVIAGALLLTPGFLTDAVGLVLFIPGFRDMLRRFLSSRLETTAETRVWVDGTEIDPARGRPGPGAGGTVIEGEYRDVSDVREAERPTRNRSR
ncbi:MAG TPA: FxsA family protein [Kiloniellales bacterium]